MVAATVCIAFVSMSVWAHHLHDRHELVRQQLLAITTMAVGVPMGIKIFNWLDDVGRPDSVQDADAVLDRVPLPVPDCRATGIIQARSFDWQLSLSYFVVAHFHYVIVGGILFALFAAFCSVPESRWTTDE